VVVRDLLYVVITVAFFALCTGLVVACDRLIGPDEDDLLDAVDGAGTESAADELAAMAGGRS